MGEVLVQKSQKFGGTDEVLASFKRTVIIKSSDLTERTAFAYWVCTDDGGCILLTEYFVKALLKPVDTAGSLLIQNANLHFSWCLQLCWFTVSKYVDAEDLVTLNGTCSWWCCGKHFWLIQDKSCCLEAQNCSLRTTVEQQAAIFSKKPIIWYMPRKKQQAGKVSDYLVKHLANVKAPGMFLRSLWSLKQS